MKSPVFISGNQNKIDYLSKTLGIELEHQKIDLDEIQSSDPKVVIEHKVKQAFEIVDKPVLVEDTSLSFNALDGLPGPFVKFFVDAENGLENMCRMVDGFEDRSAFATVIYGYYDGQSLHYFKVDSMERLLITQEVMVGMAGIRFSSQRDTAG